MSNAMFAPPPAVTSRRRLLARAGLLGAGAALGSGLLPVGRDRRGNEAEAASKIAFGPTTGEKKFAVTDLDILTFALNTEYFEAEFYQRAVNGTGLPASLLSGVQGYGAKPYAAATPGAVSVYSPGTSTIVSSVNNTTPTPVAFTDTDVQQFFQEIAQDEADHVMFLRTALGKYAPARPASDYSGAFTTAMTAAGVIPAGSTFDPFASQTNFLLAAYFINDIGVTAYVGASPYISSPTNLEAAAGILGVEAYHAGTTRTLVYALGEADSTTNLLADSAMISALQNTTASLSGSPPATAQGVLDSSGNANIIPTDGNSIAFARGFPAVLSLFYLNTATTLAPAPGGFTPSGLNGRIR